MLEPEPRRNSDNDLSLERAGMRELSPADGVWKHSPTWIIEGYVLDDMEICAASWNEASLPVIFFHVLPEEEMHVDENGKPLSDEQSRVFIMSLTTPNNDLTDFLDYVQLIGEERERIERFEDEYRNSHGIIDPDGALEEYANNLARVKAIAYRNPQGPLDR